MNWLKSGILIVAVLSAVLAAPTTFADEDSSRLPKTSIPIHYDLQLRSNVHLGQRAFEGTVRIEIEIVQDTDVITLHNRRLNVTEVKLYDSSDVEVDILSYDEDLTKEFLHIRLNPGVLNAKDHFTVEISYNGQLSTGTDGFYRSSYKIGSETR